jgi:hypothetical protein
VRGIYDKRRRKKSKGGDDMVKKIRKRCKWKCCASDRRLGEKKKRER